MRSDSHHLDLFCRVNVQAAMPHGEFVSFIARIVGGTSRLNAVQNSKLDISVDDNDVFDAEKSSTGADRWLYFRYTLEIDPMTGVTDGDYLTAVSALLQSLWSSGLNAVASCDFEDKLPPNMRRSRWAGTQRAGDDHAHAPRVERLGDEQQTPKKAS